VVKIQLNTVTFPTYPEKFTRDDVLAPFIIVPTSVPLSSHCRRAYMVRVTISISVRVFKAFFFNAFSFFGSAYTATPEVYGFRRTGWTKKGNSVDQLRHPRSDAYSAEKVLLNKRQIWRGGAYLHCYHTVRQITH